MVLIKIKIQQASPPINSVHWLDRIKGQQDSEAEMNEVALVMLARYKSYTYCVVSMQKVLGSITAPHSPPLTGQQSSLGYSSSPLPKRQASPTPGLSVAQSVIVPISSPPTQLQSLQPALSHSLVMSLSVQILSTPSGHL